MPIQETVSFIFTRVAQPLVALLAVKEQSLLLPIFKQPAQRPRLSFPSLESRMGKCLRERVCTGVGTLPGFFRLQYSPMSSRASCSRKFLMHPWPVHERPRSYKCTSSDHQYLFPTLREVLPQNERFGDRHVKQKVEDVPVELS